MFNDIKIIKIKLAALPKCLSFLLFGPVCYEAAAVRASSSVRSWGPRAILKIDQREGRGCESIVEPYVDKVAGGGRF